MAATGAMVLAYAVCGSANAGCVPVHPNVVACFDPRSAAAAYRVVGRDGGGLARDNIRALVGSWRCVRFSSVADPGAPVLTYGQGRVPDLQGWVDVRGVVVKAAAYGQTQVYVAADWLAGECEQLKPSAG